MLEFNLINNLILSIICAYGCLSKNKEEKGNKKFFLRIKDIISIYLFLFYFVDTMECLFLSKNYYIVPHHLVAIILSIYTLANDYSNIEIYNFCVVLFLLEITSFMLNCRKLMIKGNMIDINYETGFLSIYTIIRSVIFPYFLYNFCGSKKEILVSGSLIFAMSVYHIILWFKKYGKRY